MFVINLKHKKCMHTRNLSRLSSLRFHFENARMFSEHLEKLRVHSKELTRGHPKVEKSENDSHMK